MLRTTGYKYVYKDELGKRNLQSAELSWQWVSVA